MLSLCEYTLDGRPGLQWWPASVPSAHLQRVEPSTRRVPSGPVRENILEFLTVHNKLTYVLISSVKSRGLQPCPFVFMVRGCSVHQAKISLSRRTNPTIVRHPWQSFKNKYDARTTGACFFHWRIQSANFLGKNRGSWILYLMKLLSEWSSEPKINNVQGASLVTRVTWELRFRSMFCNVLITTDVVERRMCPKNLA